MRKAGMDKCNVMPCWAYKCIWLCWHSEAQVGQNFYGMGLRSMTIPAASIALGDVWDPPSHVLVALRWCPRGMRWRVCKPTAHAMRTCIRGPGAARPVPHTCTCPTATCISASVFACAFVFSPSARGPGGGGAPDGRIAPMARARWRVMASRHQLADWRPYLPVQLQAVGRSECVFTHAVEFWAHPMVCHACHAAHSTEAGASAIHSAQLHNAGEHERARDGC